MLISKTKAKHRIHYILNRVHRNQKKENANCFRYVWHGVDFDHLFPICAL